MSNSKAFGQLPPQYGFAFNPYPNERYSRCPDCQGKTRQRKLPLLIHVKPAHLIALNYTCRYCPSCDFLIAHKHEVEHLLTELFRRNDPSVIGNEYLVIGTLEKKAWREGVTQPQSIEQMRANLHDFKDHYQDLQVRAGGWYHEDQEPPILTPPPSEEWVKPKRSKLKNTHSIR